MTVDPVKRRLAAILAADVVGYSRMMEAGEEHTMAALTLLRREFFDPTVTRHGGRIFKVMGDGFMVEFGSVLNATRCALEIQTGMAERNQDVPPDQRIVFRIGVNLGDVMVDGADLNGDGVNLAVTSRQVVWLFSEQVRLECVPVLHRLQGRLAAQR